MTNYDRLHNMSLEELGKELCVSIEIIGDNTTEGLCCNICPVEHLCKKGKNGFITWLEQEVTEE